MFKGLKPVTTSGGRKPVRRFQPGVDVLEGRLVPTTYYWAPPVGGGNWSAAANWNDGAGNHQVPGDGDTAWFGVNATAKDRACVVDATTNIVTVSIDTSYNSSIRVHSDLYCGPGSNWNGASQSFDWYSAQSDAGTIHIYGDTTWQGGSVNYDGNTKGTVSVDTPLLGTTTFTVKYSAIDCGADIVVNNNTYAKFGPFVVALTFRQGGTLKVQPGGEADLGYATDQDWPTNDITQSPANTANAVNTGTIYVNKNVTMPTFGLAIINGAASAVPNNGGLLWCAGNFKITAKTSFLGTWGIDQRASGETRIGDGVSSPTLTLTYDYYQEGGLLDTYGLAGTLDVSASSNDCEIEGGKVGMYWSDKTKYGNLNVKGTVDFSGGGTLVVYVAANGGLGNYDQLNVTSGDIILGRNSKMSVYTNGMATQAASVNIMVTDGFNNDEIIGDFPAGNINWNGFEWTTSKKFLDEVYNLSHQ
jgi:hypothetical protein